MTPFVSIALMVAAIVPAQLGGGQSGMSTGTPATNLRPLAELRAYGACVARTFRKDALAIMATAPDSPEERKVLKRTMYGERSSCMFGGDRIAFSSIYARGVVAEGLLRADGVPEEYRLPAPAASEVHDLHGAARCYVVGHRNQAAAVLQTPPGSAEENKAVAAIWNDFRACMPGFTVRMNAPWIRFLLAEASLRLAPDARGSGL